MGLYVDVGYEDRMLGRALPEPAIVVRWHVRKGQWLRPGDALVDLDAGERFTARIGFPCVVDGIVAGPGDTLYRGLVLLRVGGEGEDVPAGFRYGTLDAAAPNS